MSGAAGLQAGQDQEARHHALNKDTAAGVGPGEPRHAGWHAHTLNAPGKFLISAPGHDIPRRGRAYLLTDEAVRATAEHYATTQPALDEISQQALTKRPPAGSRLEATATGAG